MAKLDILDGEELLFSDGNMDLQEAVQKLLDRLVVGSETLSFTLYGNQLQLAIWRLETHESEVTELITHTLTTKKTLKVSGLYQFGKINLSGEEAVIFLKSLSNNQQ